MAGNLSKRLDKLEKGIQQLLENHTGPVYVSQGDAIPDGREAVRIVMRWVEAEPQGDDAQLEDGQSGNGSHSLSGPNSAPRKTRSTLPPSETPAEREKRWAEHLMKIAKDRYQGEGPQRVELWYTIP